MANYYEVLGADPEATPAEIKRAYRQAARHSHPDKAGPQDKERAEKLFKLVSEAYQVLNDERQRQAYDLYLSCAPAGFVEVADQGGYVQVPFADWPEFQRILEGCASMAAAEAAGGSSASGGGHRRQREERGEGGADGDTPISAVEWLVAGTVAATLWFVAVWHHQRRQWLKALPYEIWHRHSEYTVPLGLLLSPVFFGNVPMKEFVGWFRDALRQANGGY
eukprot:TRINITY_DN21168_c0_g1_i1.p1 TRINITY_DN21168_c0_g1~~TRINITY_DN21168_c0_g1_i1.p1  ORF type:complete len:221 (-),score=35.88 TRINITY_DN21168_c0_g1_i1:58-720(-)